MSHNSIIYNPDEILEIIDSTMRDIKLVKHKFKDNRSKYPMIVITSMPNSGEQFILEVIKNLYNKSLKRAKLYQSNNQEHDLFAPALSLFNYTGTISKLHMQGNITNTNLMMCFGIKPIIIIRNIFDIINNLIVNSNNAMGNIDSIIQTKIPWYINFYVSWYYLCQQKEIDALWKNHDEIMLNPFQSIKDIVTFLNLKELQDKKIENSINQESLHLNNNYDRKQKSLLSKEQKFNVIKLTRYYPDVDFSPILVK